jgi:hypothetical protein
MNARVIVAVLNNRRLSAHVGVGRSDVTFKDADQVAWDATRQTMSAVGGAHIMSMSDESFRGVKEMIILHPENFARLYREMWIGQEVALAQAVGGLSRSRFARAIGVGLINDSLFSRILESVERAEADAHTSKMLFYLYLALLPQIAAARERLEVVGDPMKALVLMMSLPRI